MNGNQRINNIKGAFASYIDATGKNLRIVKQIGGNSCCGIVFEVEDLTTGEKLAMKAVDSGIVEANCSNSDMIKYTRAEIKAMRDCADCEFIMDIYDAADCIINEETDEHVFLIFMPILIPANEFIESKGFPQELILSMTKDVCRALDYCHSKGILHRDVKPANIFYSEKLGHFVLGDFGVSRSMLNAKFAVTPIGAYLAPEIRCGRNLKGRYNSDVFSLGIATLLLLGGRGNIFNEIKAILQNMKPESLRVVLQKAIAADPAVRYQTAKEFLSELEAVELEEHDAKALPDDIDACVKAIIDGKGNHALSLAKKGHDSGNIVMSSLYAYILHCKNDSETAIKVLLPIKDKNKVAHGLYGIIGYMIAQLKRNKAEMQKYLECIKRSAKNGFSAAQYIIGRWYIDGQAGLEKNKDLGLELIFDSGKKMFRPALYYLRDVLMRDDTEIEDSQAMIDLLAIQLDGYTEDQFPVDMIAAIAVEC